MKIICEVEINLTEQEEDYIKAMSAVEKSKWLDDLEELIEIDFNEFENVITRANIIEVENDTKGIFKPSITD